jgi:hypothetical protein
MTSPHPPETKPYEERDVAMRPIVLAAIGLGVLAVGTSLLMQVVDRRLVARETSRSAAASPLAATYGREAPPAPRLQDDPRRDLADLRAREQSLLDSYGWIDRGAGRVRIPVARAAELLAAEAPR